MNPKVLTVYKSPFEKQRLGKSYDGGYIYIKVPNVSYNLLLAGGISNDISFEEAFINIFPNVKAHAFDGTINKLPKNNNKITFTKKNIGSENNENFTNLHSLIDANEDIFVKMDIEGGEIPWIRSLNDNQLNKFSQIVMEFHAPFSHKEIEVFDKLNKNHYLVHFHANNCCGVRTHQNVIIPNVFECTYLHKKYFKEPPQLNNEKIPSNIDMRNLVNKPEIELNHPPFVHT